MTLGETIARLRAERRMSQGDLADALGVSRQSVSKWETNGAVPDLDKLVRLSELFGVTLDELVKGEAGERPPEAPVRRAPPAPAGIPPWRVALGAALLAVGLLGILLMTFLGSLTDLPMAALLLSPLIVCGLICLRVQNRPGLWCGWAAWVLQQIWWGWAGGEKWWHGFYPASWWPGGGHVLISLALLLTLLALLGATLWSFRRARLERGRGGRVLLAAWAAPVAWTLAWRALVRALFAAGGRIPDQWVFLLSVADALWPILLTAAITLTAAALRGRRAGEGR